MPNILDSIQVSGSSYDIKDKNAPSVSAVTQQEYDNLPSSAKTSNTFFVITDATPIETSGFVQTSAITSSVTSASTDSQIPTAKAVWEAASGGGSTYTAGRGISIANDTISFNLPISAGTGSNSIAEGRDTIASGGCSHAEGYKTQANGNFSHAEGRGTTANTDYSHAEGQNTIASGYFSHAEGYSTEAKANYSHAEGQNTKANGISSHAEGSETIVSGEASHAEGWATTASGQSSHAEGYLAQANGDRSHAEGYGTKASGDSSHAEGSSTRANGDSSHAEGGSTRANGDSSHAEGVSTIANNQSEHASGKFNVSNTGSTDADKTLFSVGNGTADNARHNAFEIRQNGDIYLSSGGTDIKLQDHLGGSGGGGTVDQTIISGDTNAVAGGAVYNAVVYSANTYTTELTFDANEYAENWIVGQSAITIDVSGYTSDAMADYRFENSNGANLGSAFISKTISSWGNQWYNSANNCTITTDGDTATTAIITDIPSGTVKIRRGNASNPPKAIISGDTPETWIKDALDDHRDNTTVHITAQERSTWNNKSNFSGSYNDLTDKPIPDSALTSYSTNAVQSKTLYDELRVSGSGQVSDVTVEFDSQGDSTNFPNNCTTVKVEVSGSNNHAFIHFRSGGYEVGYVVVNNYGSITVYNSDFADSSYEISGNTAIITYPLSKQIDGLNVDNDSAPYTIKATPGVSYTPLKDVVAENTTALGGLKLVKLSQSDYDALTTKDDNTVYFIGDSTNGYTMKIGSANVN